jgi:hypothetical protein
MSETRPYGAGKIPDVQLPGMARKPPTPPAMQPPDEQDMPTMEAPQTIGKEQVRKAMDLLLKYKNGKQALEQRIVENEEWWRLRANQAKKSKDRRVDQQSSAWLFNMIFMKVADFSNNIPEANVLPREEGDKGVAAQLSEIIPVILERAEYEKTYVDCALTKIKNGASVKGVFWNKDLENGLGEVDIKEVDLLNLFWEPGISDIQDSPHLFHVALRNNDALKRQYADKDLKLAGKAIDVKEYVYDDNIDTTDKSVVVDWYYKVQDGPRSVVHLCQFVNETILFASENEPALADVGIYNHGLFPFIPDRLFPIKGSPAGFGFIDVAKTPQEYIDKLDQAILTNALSNANARWYAKSDGGVNEEEYLDFTRPIVHVNGSIDDEHLRQIPNSMLDGSYLTVRQEKINELKEVTGNRDFNQGGTAGGVTAASAIGALIATGNKGAESMISGSYRAFRKEINLVIELIRQFYTEPRKFRLLGTGNVERFVSFDNRGMQEQQQGGVEFGIDMGLRLPVYDISIRAQKMNPFSKQGQNELAQQFFAMGFFNPQMADQALACLEMMADFEGKEDVIQRISQNGMMYQQILMMQQQMQKMAMIIDGTQGTNIAQQMAGGPEGGAPPQPREAPKPESEKDPGGGKAKLASAMERATLSVEG